MRKTNSVVSKQVRQSELCRHRRLEAGNFRLKKENDYPCSKKGADQLRSYYKADLSQDFAYAKCWFSHNAAHIKWISR